MAEERKTAAGAHLRDGGAPAEAKQEAGGVKAVVVTALQGAAVLEQCQGGLCRQGTGARGCSVMQESHRYTHRVTLTSMALLSRMCLHSATAASDWEQWHAAASLAGASLWGLNRRQRTAWGGHTNAAHTFKQPRERLQQEEGVGERGKEARHCPCPYTHTSTSYLS